MLQANTGFALPTSDVHEYCTCALNGDSGRNIASC